ncbi:MAG: hypothetical protein VYE22_32340 [Myxococcota bacterium]|nr:hypothetical protein [Myxococcota bacterium]
MRALLLSVFALSACTATLPEGQYRCDEEGVTDQCPDGWRCVAGRCRSVAGGLDASTEDAGTEDAGDGDRGDAEIPDAGRPDAGLGPVEREPAAIVTPVPSMAGDRFGASISVRGRSMAVGAPSPRVPLEGGRVFLFGLEGGFAQVGLLELPTSVGRERLGASVAVGEGMDVFAGAPGADAVYRFMRARAMALTREGGELGASVAFVGPGVIAAGAPTLDSASIRDGSVYRIGFDGGDDAIVDRGGAAQAGERFGSALAADEATGRLAATAAPEEDSGAPGYVVLDSQTAGTTLRIEHGGAGFGRSVALLADDVAVGADGRVHLFDADTGAATGVIEAPEAGSDFGAAVCARDGWLVVGAPAAGAGAAHVYRVADRAHVARLLAPPGVSELGAACAVIGDMAYVGAPGSDDGGRVVVYALEEGGP